MYTSKYLCSITFKTKKSIHQHQWFSIRVCGIITIDRPNGRLVCVESSRVDLIRVIYSF